MDSFLHRFESIRKVMAIEGKDVARTFGSIFHTLLRAGEGDSERVSISKSILFNYSSRIFDLKPAALTEAILILKKAGLVLDVGDRVVVKEPSRIEDFFEYFQFYWYQDDLRDYLHPSSSISVVLATILEGRGDEIVFPIEDFSKALMRKHKLSLDKELIENLQKRGLSLKKSSSPDGGFDLLFDRKEVDRLLWIQNLLALIDERIEKAS